MKKLLVITLALLLLASCGGAETDDSVVKDANEGVEYDANLEAPSEVIYWQRSNTAKNCSLLSENIYSMEDELYIIDKALEPLSKNSKVLDLSGEAVEASVFKDKNGDLKFLDFNGVNREAIWICDNKAVIVDYYANQLFAFDAATNSVTSILSDNAYGFGFDEYESLAGKYDRIVWLDVPAVSSNGNRIVYWSNKYADNGIMTLNPGIWISDLQAGSEYRLNLGELVPTVENINWIDDETIMFAAENGGYYKLNIASNELEELNLPADTYIAVSNSYAVYKTDNAVFVNELSDNSVTEYTLTEPVSFDKVFERNGIIAFSSLKDGSVWMIENETNSLDNCEVILEDNQFAHLNGWSEYGLIIEILDTSTNETAKICGMPIGGLTWQDE